MSANLLLGDIKKAFLQVGVKGKDRDSVRFPFNVKGVVAIAIVDHEGVVAKGLLTSKSRKLKRNTLVARLELVSGHMAANRAKNLYTALQRWSIKSNHLDGQHGSIVLVNQSWEGMESVCG